MIGDEELFLRMSEGNPGALTVLMNLRNAGEIVTIVGLSQLKFTGPKIWVAYKDHCGQDLQKLIRAVNERDPQMIETVERECG